MLKTKHFHVCLLSNKDPNENMIIKKVIESLGNYFNRDLDSVLRLSCVRIWLFQLFSNIPSIMKYMIEKSNDYKAGGLNH